MTNRQERNWGRGKRAAVQGVQKRDELRGSGGGGRTMQAIADSISELRAEIDRHATKYFDDSKKETRRRWWEICGLWAAALVGATAVFVGNNDATDQAKITTRQLVQMEKQITLTQIQLAPRLRLKEVLSEPLRDDKHNITGWRFSQSIENVGASDAKQFRFHWRRSLVFPATSPYDDCPFNMPNNLSEPQDVSPGDPVTFQSLDVSNEEMVSIYQKKMSLYLFGILEYRDVFENTALHKQKWCFLVSPNDLENNKFSYFVKLVEKK